MFAKLKQLFLGDPDICRHDPQLSVVRPGWEIDPIGDRRVFLTTLLRAAPQDSILHIQGVVKPEKLLAVPGPWVQFRRGGILTTSVFHVTVNPASLGPLAELVATVEIEKEWGYTQLFNGDQLFLEAPDFMDVCTFVCGHTFDAQIEAMNDARVIEASWFEPDRKNR